MKFPTFNMANWLLQTVAMALTCYLIPKLRITSIFGAFFTVVALAFINANVWDFALFMKIPDEPTNKMVVLFLVNGALFCILLKLLPGIEVEGVTPALIAPVVFTVCSFLISALVKDVNWQEVYSWTMNILTNLKDYIAHEFFEAEELVNNPTP